jgi:indole-3-acetate monooxygenase
MFNIANGLDLQAMNDATHSDKSVEETLAAVRELEPTIRAAADEIERERRLPIHIVKKIQRAGVFRMTMPRHWGGSELDPLSQLEVIEALSKADASVGWCTMIGCDGGYTTAFIDQSVAREMYTDVDMVTAITFAPPGKAVKTKDGFIVNGRWPFASGCQHASWFIGHFAIFDGDSPRLDRNGVPETCFGFLPPVECEIIDTWKTNGLRGSGSHDWAVTDRFIPEARTINLARPVSYREGPLYQLPNMFFYKFSGVCLGIARGAIEDFIALAQKKPITISSPGAGKVMMRDETCLQQTIAQAEAMVSSARAFVFETVGDMWNTLTARHFPSNKQRARARLAIAHASNACLQAVELLYKANGGSSVYSGSPFDRRLRDIQTVNQHTLVSLKTWEVMGRVLMGLEPNYGFRF